MPLNQPRWEFCPCYRDGDFSHWEWRRRDRESVVASTIGFPSLSLCVHDSMKHGYTGGGKIMPDMPGVH